MGRDSAVRSVGLRRVLVTLCFTEITSWGVLYYAFTVLAPAICRDTGWSAPAVTAAFYSGLVTAALVGVVVGHWLDRRGPRGVMTAGSVMAVFALCAVVAAPNFAWFVAAWVIAGVTMSGVFYALAFAALTRWYGPDAVGALTVLTLVAGLASTVFAPLTAALSLGVELAQYLSRARRLVGSHDSGALFRTAARVACNSGASSLGVPYEHGAKPLIRGVDGGVRDGSMRLIRHHREPSAADGRARYHHGCCCNRSWTGRRGASPRQAWLPTPPAAHPGGARTILIMVGVAVTTALLGILTSLAALVVAAVRPGSFAAS